MTDLFLKVFDMSIASCLFIAAVILLRLLLGKAPKWIMPLLWIMVGVRLLIPLDIRSDFSLVPEVGLSAERADVIYVNQAEAVYAESAEPQSVLEQPAFESAGDAEIKKIWTDIKAIASVVWLTGCLIMLLNALIAYIRLKRGLSDAVRVYYPSDIVKNIPVMESDYVSTPFVLGVLNPVIYIPSGIREGDMDKVLSHERAHISRFDHIVKPVWYTLLCVHWFNPLVWIAYKLMCHDIELACDEKVIKGLDHAGKRAYALSLLCYSVKEGSITTSPLMFGGPDVKRRVKAVMDYRKKSVLTTVLTVLLCMVVTGCFITTRETKEESSVTSVQNNDESENMKSELNALENASTEAIVRIQEGVEKEKRELNTKAEAVEEEAIRLQKEAAQEKMEELEAAANSIKERQAALQKEEIKKAEEELDAAEKRYFEIDELHKEESEYEYVPAPGNENDDLELIKEN